MALLDVKNVKKIYTTRFGKNQVEALKNVTFSVEEGEYVAIMGESGSGKTTLLNILAALDKPTQGKVYLKGSDLGGLREKEISAFRRENLGFVFQDFNLLDTLTAYENIALALSIQNTNSKEISKSREKFRNRLFDNLFSHFYCSVCSQYIGKCEIIIFFTSSFIKKYSI